MPDRCRPSAPRIAAAALASLAAHQAHSQPAPRNTTVDLNYVYAASLGFGGYSLGGLDVGVYTLPLADPPHDLPYKGWSLRLLLPLQLGIYDFKSTFQGVPISLHQQSIAAVPGAELQIPLTGNFVVKPFAQFGVAHAFGTDGQNPDAWIYLTGARSVAQWQTGAYTLSLGNGIIFSGDNTIGSGFSAHYVALQLAGEIRRPLDFRIGQWTPDLGLYAASSSPAS